jgi:hypothetical protein
LKADLFVDALHGRILTLFLPQSGKNINSRGLPPAAIDVRPLRIELHCALETGYTVTLLSISNLAGYKPVTSRLQLGYTVTSLSISNLARNILELKCPFL